jgi:hypothetical protein
MIRRRVRHSEQRQLTRPEPSLADDNLWYLLAGIAAQMRWRICMKRLSQLALGPRYRHRMGPGSSKASCQQTMANKSCRSKDEIYQRFRYGKRFAPLVRPAAQFSIFFPPRSVLMRCPSSFSEASIPKELLMSMSQECTYRGRNISTEYYVPV